VTEYNATIMENSIGPLWYLLEMGNF
jgi:hypothetical protein